MSTIFHPALHPVFETLAYAGGFQLYRWQKRRSGDFLQETQRWNVIAAAIVGAVVGSRVLGLLEQWPLLATMSWKQILFGSGGKTIVGGLLGGWLAVELVKWMSGIRRRTGDLFALPLCLGIAIGRVGCFLAGLADDTYGKATSLPWGVDFGDGVRRHPTQLYEIVFLLVLAAVIWSVSRRPHTQGVLFRIFLVGYLAWRFAIDFIKPQPFLHGLNAIQWACVGGLVLCLLGTLFVARRKL